MLAVVDVEDMDKRWLENCVGVEGGVGEPKACDNIVSILILR